MSVKRAKAVKASLGKQHHHDSARARGRTSAVTPEKKRSTGAAKPAPSKVAGARATKGRA